jgi:hypothetical protein
MSLTLDGTNGITVPATATNQSGAVAWVNFTGSTGAIVSSYNVSSISRASAGVYTINMTNALVDNKYIVLATSSATSGGVYPGAAGMFSTISNVYTAPTTTSFIMYQINYLGSTSIDPVYVGLAVFR